MPYEYPRPTPMIMAGPSTLPNQGVEELRDEDRSRAWICEREELLQQIKEKDALIEFLEHQVIDDPVSTNTLDKASSLQFIEMCKAKLWSFPSSRRSASQKLKLLQAVMFATILLNCSICDIVVHVCHVQHPLQSFTVWLRIHQQR